MPDEFQRRLPSTERTIAEIKPEDIRINIVGTIIDKNDDSTSIVIDDGSGKVAVSFETAQSAEINQFVRVFGRAIPLENGVELQGEIIQDMSKLDKGLLKKVKGLKM